MNGPTAEEYAVLMGTSHHEPMARSEKEQQRNVKGNWDWVANPDEITEFFEYGVNRSSHWDTMFTMGMRGAGDAESPTLNPEAIEDIIIVQQNVLRDILAEENLGKVQQTCVLYKVSQDIRVYPCSLPG